VLAGIALEIDSNSAMADLGAERCASFSLTRRAGHRETPVLRLHVGITSREQPDFTKTALKFQLRETVGNIETWCSWAIIFREDKGW
jgi:hypothetical protein